jgi:hypothetical protein
MLDGLDWELDRRGHRFVRYADDGRIYVASERAGQRVMESVTQYVEQRLKLKVNREKSVVDWATKRTLLGFGFFRRDGEVKVRVDRKARERAKDRLRRLTSRRWGISMKRRITEINRFRSGGRLTSCWPIHPRRLRSSISGSDAGYGRSAGRSGNVSTPSDATWSRSVSPRVRPISGLAHARDTGASPGRRRSSVPYQTPTGPATA